MPLEAEANNIENKTICLFWDFRGRALGGEQILDAVNVVATALGSVLARIGFLGYLQHRLVTQRPYAFLGTKGGRQSGRIVPSFFDRCFERGNTGRSVVTAALLRLIFGELFPPSRKS